MSTSTSKATPAVTRGLSFALVAFIFAAPTLTLAQTRVSFHTPLGNFVVEMFDDDAPATVANFLQYVEDGDYNNAFIHRSVPGFVVQGGGFIFDEEGNVVSVPTDPPVVNEFNRSNTRGTIAMAKLAGDSDSATSQWFFNLEDNSGNLDNQNGGFTAFGQVIGEGMEVVDAIASLQRWNAGAGFEELPLIDYPGNNVAIDETHIVFTELGVVAPEPVAVPATSPFAIVIGWACVSLAAVSSLRRRQTRVASKSV